MLTFHILHVYFDKIQPHQFKYVLCILYVLAFAGVCEYVPDMWVSGLWLASHHRSTSAALRLGQRPSHGRTTERGLPSTDSRATWRNVTSIQKNNSRVVTHCRGEHGGRPTECARDRLPPRQRNICGTTVRTNTVCAAQPHAIWTISWRAVHISGRYQAKTTSQKWRVELCDGWAPLRTRYDDDEMIPIGPEETKHFINNLRNQITRDHRQITPSAPEVD